MKNLILLIAVMVVSAYATTSTVKSVTGAYEHKRGEDTFRMVFLENGISERYTNGKKEEKEGKWKISEEGELHLRECFDNGHEPVCYECMNGRGSDPEEFEER